MTTPILRALVLTAIVAVLPAGAAAAQAPQTPAEKPAAQPPVEKPAQPAASPGGYSYNRDTRRDPFISLLGRASDPRSATNRPTGLAGFLINEVIVTGIIKGGASGYVATLRGPDSKSYIVRSGERLMDGTVKSISERQVVFSQDVNDPLSLIKQREIPKSVRPGGESIQ